MKITVNCPSYKRPKVKTLSYLPFCKVWVDCDEYDEYIKANKGYEDNIISVPKGVQGNVSRIRNYILDQEFSNGVDGVILVDDDMRGMFYWGEDGKSHKIEANYFLEWAEKYFTMCDDAGLKMWGVNVNPDRRSYRSFKPFSFLCFTGGPFQAFLNNPLRYDETLPLKEDYDMVIQQCNKYRGVFRVDFCYYDVLQSENKGGCAAYRNREREREQLLAIRKKWGGRIVRFDKTNRSGKQERFEDYNPIIRLPIKGV